MAIQSREHLQRLLNQIPSLNEHDVSLIVSRAHYGANGHVNGIYVRSLLTKCTHSEIRQFLVAAGAYHPQYGGDEAGDIVRPDAYPTGDMSNPCVERDDHWCWEGRRRLGANFRR